MPQTTRHKARPTVPPGTRNRPGENDRDQSRKTGGSGPDVIETHEEAGVEGVKESEGVMESEGSPPLPGKGDTGGGRRSASEGQIESRAARQRKGGASEGEKDRCGCG